MQRPEDSTVELVLPSLECFKEPTDEIASSYISMLDEKFSREDVSKIAEWIHYLSTQS